MSIPPAAYPQVHLSLSLCVCETQHIPCRQPVPKVTPPSEPPGDDPSIHLLPCNRHDPPVNLSSQPPPSRTGMCALQLVTLSPSPLLWARHGRLPAGLPACLPACQSAAPRPPYASIPSPARVHRDTASEAAGWQTGRPAVPPWRHVTRLVRAQEAGTSETSSAADGTCRTHSSGLLIRGGGSQDDTKVSQYSLV